MKPIKEDHRIRFVGGPAHNQMPHVRGETFSAYVFVIEHPPFDHSWAAYLVGRCGAWRIHRYVLLS